ncbi:MAG: glutamate-ammonia-ligase adenylyltransferase, partial [Candidatus Methylomirabilales bacterium]
MARSFRLPMKEEDLTLLNRTGLKDLQRARRNLELLTTKGIHGEAFGALLPSFLEALKNAPDPDMALNNFERYAEAVVDRGFFYSLLKENRKILDLALTIFGSSQCLSDLLIRFPHDFYWLLEPGVLRKPRPKEELEADLSASLAWVSSFEGKLGALRRFKARELLRIGLQDLLGNLDLVGVTQELSNLADVSLQKAYEICSGELKRRYGIPQSLDEEGQLRECRFAVIGMGKLGGSELNFSSDIDLLFVYEAEGETTGIRTPSGESSGKITNKQFFVRLGELLIKAIGEVTSDGRVFRVDMRLRPEGQAGDLALSINAYQLYYGSYGREWERLALIKARPVAGDPELGQAFLEMVTPFVYRKSLDFGALAEIRALKEKINLSVALEGKIYRDVKLGYGGIREVEFVVQAFQLLYGGRDPWIREPNTLRALHRLSERGYLSYDDYDALAKAYTFLRTVEHRLQILHQLQTHTLPEDRRELTRLARRLGYRGEDPATSFLQELKAHTEAVRRIYESLLRESPGEEGFMPSYSGETPPLQLFFEADFPLEQIRECLSGVGFKDVERALRGFLALRDGPPFVHYSPESRRALAKLVPKLLQA